jgi:predicted lipoprotein with Yx(FWY)xxD motif
MKGWTVSPVAMAAEPPSKEGRTPSMDYGLESTRGQRHPRLGGFRAHAGRKLLATVVAISTAVVVAFAFSQALPAAASATTVDMATNATFGAILTDAQGFALYTFANDANGISSCNASCLAVWPALTVPDGTTPTGGPGVTGTVAAVLQPNGTDQVTYNGSPLYTFVGDTSAGQVTGNNVGGFSVVQISAPPPPPPTAPPPPTTTVPGAPTSLTAMGGDGAVILNWAAPTNTGGSAITGYDILRGTTPMGESSTPIASSVSGTTYTDTTPTNGTTYYYEVEALNTVGASSPSNETPATPAAPPPPPPTAPPPPTTPPPATTPPPPTPVPTMASTTLSTALSGDGQSGPTITVPAGATVVDQATLSGPNAASAGGTVTYRIYSLSFVHSPFFCSGFSAWLGWWWQPVAIGGTFDVDDGSIPASNPVTLGAGVYFWQASYSGDTLNGATRTTRGSETEIVLPPPRCAAGSGWWSARCVSGDDFGNGNGYRSANNEHTETHGNGNDQGYGYRR